MKDEREETESDPNKAASNIKKHKKKNGEGLSFGEAEEVFDVGDGRYLIVEG